LGKKQRNVAGDSGDYNLDLLLSEKSVIPENGLVRI
jgi:hypothetical protein